MTLEAKFSTATSLIATICFAISALRLRDVELNAALPLVVLVEVTRAVHSRLAVRPRRQHTKCADPAHRLHSNDLGPHVGELHRASRSGPDPGEVRDAD